jgi:hypothetical protein
MKKKSLKQKAFQGSWLWFTARCNALTKKKFFFVLVPEAQHVAIRIAGVSAFLHEPLDLLLFSAQEFAV